MKKVPESGTDGKSVRDPLKLPLWASAVICYMWWIKKAESVILELHLTKYLFTRVFFQKDKKNIKKFEKLNKPLTHVGLLTVFFDPSPNCPQLLLPNMYSLPFPEKKKKSTVRTHTSIWIPHSRPDRHPHTMLFITSFLK